MIHPKVLLNEAIYYAPRGEARLMLLGSIIVQNFLFPSDKLIGVIGDAGAGKSILIRGMFPGLNLTNDDEGVYRRPLPILDDYERGKFYEFIYHIDVRFEMAFTPVYILADAILSALNSGKKVVCEHFELLYPYLRRNADLLIGIGEEVIVSRPNLFGPEPKEIADTVFLSLGYRLRAHTAEDLVGLVLEEEGYQKIIKGHGDIKHGFVINLEEKPMITLKEIERRVKKYMKDSLQVSYVDSQHIKIGEKIINCTGPRVHVRNTAEIQEFFLFPEYLYSKEDETFLLIGFVDQDEYNKVVKKQKKEEENNDKN
ncbi:MAG TPA: alanine-tRNA synthetase second additional domain-containing protein [Dictyoglomaceae bacterium]|nr:alanine-tRNA synthetase second additional domain-containing protein [Dictyoglomaceae bacterium]HOL38936.1 alanine-tRNA synthetase second additional domain-containing protein [Dictyoglomaceae bacterium]HOP94876.1 alanine-tRNA synthetase second additional domain-containing protein [Dictyoglomaceae bacterium]HPP15647.1 alanine-tRNA synthetase second additional domain-containing protein [Dictyoglomaceae bacterium]HPU43819.1 alanine-tRNA synthetase second additional domain-containing protein [Dic